VLNSLNIFEDDKLIAVMDQTVNNDDSNVDNDDSNVDNDRSEPPPMPWFGMDIGNFFPLKLKLRTIFFVS
jgi:hypothetical protein